jgi:hypothetical protein
MVTRRRNTCERGPQLREKSTNQCSCNGAKQVPHFLISPATDNRGSEKGKGSAHFESLHAPLIRALASAATIPKPPTRADTRRSFAAASPWTAASQSLLRCRCCSGPCLRGGRKRELRRAFYKESTWSWAHTRWHTIVQMGTTLASARVCAHCHWQTCPHPQQRE